MEERREILGRLCRVYIVIEGGPGTEHEAQVATSQGAFIIPIAISGGCSSKLYKNITPSSSIDQKDWDLLNDKQQKSKEIGVLVKQMVANLLNI